MIEVRFYDQFDNEFSDTVFYFEELPKLNQRINLDNLGLFQVGEIIIDINRFSPNAPRYRIFLHRVKPPLGTIRQIDNVISEVL